MEKVLISGAGIAGCCLAWWLDRFGTDVTVVERAPEFRRGGYVIDFWGPGYEVAERMGIIDTLKAEDLQIDGLKIVDTRGRRVSGLNQRSLRDLTNGRLMSIPRAALAGTLYDAIKERVEVRFGESVSALTQTDSGVDVRFAGGAMESYDLVFGADGLHSAIRKLCFGTETKFEDFLGFYAAAFTAKGYPHRDPHTYVMHTAPGRALARITLEEDACVFLLLFAKKRPLHLAADDITGQKLQLKRLFADAEWEADDMLRALDEADDLYFDRMSQIEMPTWTNGRIALLGDACGCPSLLAGEGSSMAMLEAYILAGELHKASGDHDRAFEAYEARLSSYVHQKQKAARSFASAFIPKTKVGLWLRDVSLNVISGLGLSRFAFRAQLGNEISLPDYP